MYLKTHSIRWYITYLLSVLIHNLLFHFYIICTSLNGLMSGVLINSLYHYSNLYSNLICVVMVSSQALSFSLLICLCTYCYGLLFTSHSQLCLSHYAHHLLMSFLLDTLHTNTCSIINTCSRNTCQVSNVLGEHSA